MEEDIFNTAYVDIIYRHEQTHTHLIVFSLEILKYDFFLNFYHLINSDSSLPQGGQISDWLKSIFVSGVCLNPLQNVFQKTHKKMKCLFIWIITVALKLGG